MTRKIIQIATLSPALSESMNLFMTRKRYLTGRVIALCDDASVWALDVDPDNVDSKPQWARLPEITQD